MPGKMPPIRDSIASGNRMSKMEADEMKAMRRRKMPSTGDSIASGNRVSKQNAAEMKALGLKKGGKVKKYAMGGSVMGRPDAMPVGGSGRGMVVRPGPMGGIGGGMPARAAAMMPRMAMKKGGKVGCGHKGMKKK